jgi:hypothetical protein
MTDSRNDLANVLSRIKAFLRAEVYPLEQDFLRRPFRDLVPVLNLKRQQVKAFGLWAPHLPHEYGGLGLKLSEFAYVSEELGRTPIGHYLFNCQAPDIGNTEIFYYTYGLFKIAVIVQQIYFRHRQGITQDRRFADLGGLVKACGTLAQRAIEKGRIDRLG